VLDFIALKNPSPLAGFELANLGSSGKHANLYSTEATDPTIDSTTVSFAYLVTRVVAVRT
jgi:hypothetical protein